MFQSCRTRLRLPLDYKFTTPSNSNLRTRDRHWTDKLSSRSLLDWNLGCDDRIIHCRVRTCHAGRLVRKDLIPTTMQQMENYPEANQHERPTKSHSGMLRCLSSIVRQRGTWNLSVRTAIRHEPSHRGPCGLGRDCGRRGKPLTTQSPAVVATSQSGSEEIREIAFGGHGQANPCPVQCNMHPEPDSLLRSPLYSLRESLSPNECRAD